MRGISAAAGLLIAGLAVGSAHASGCSAGTCTGVFVTTVLGASGNSAGDNRQCFFFEVGSTWYAIPYADPGAPYNIGRIRQVFATASAISFAYSGATVCGQLLADDIQ